MRCKTVVFRLFLDAFFCCFVSRKSHRPSPKYITIMFYLIILPRKTKPARNDKTTRIQVPAVTRHPMSLCVLAWFNKLMNIFLQLITRWFSKTGQKQQILRANGRRYCVCSDCEYFIPFVTSFLFSFFLCFFSDLAYLALKCVLVLIFSCFLLVFLV